MAIVHGPLFINKVGMKVQRQYLMNWRYKVIHGKKYNIIGQTVI